VPAKPKFWHDIATGGTDHGRSPPQPSRWDPLTPQPPLRADIRATLVLAGPLVANQLTAMGATIVQILLAGHLGADVLGAVAVGTNVYFLALMAVVGTIMVVPPSVAQLDGAGRRGEIASLFRQAVWLALALGIVMAALLLFLAPPLVTALGVPPELRAEASGFLRAASFSLPALGLYLACRGVSEGLSMPRPAMVIALSSLLLLAPVGYALTHFLPLGAFGLGLAMTLVW